jgi:DNA-directed RNA polymerase subunit RPC12/RpoP
MPRTSTRPKSNKRIHTGLVRCFPETLANVRRIAAARGLLIADVLELAVTDLLRKETQKECRYCGAKVLEQNRKTNEHLPSCPLRPSAGT